MPTGYTTDVVDGKVTDFPTFAMTCARAFGALIMMRDDPMSVPIPEEVAPDTSYYDGAIAKATARLSELQSMRAEEASAAAVTAYQDALAGRARYIANKDTEAARINAMLAQVQSWRPPTPDHQEMKSFMVQQLTISLPGEYAPAIPALLDGEAWRSAEIKSAAETLAHSKVERAKEIERARGRTQWIKDLRASLTSPALAEGSAGK